MELNATPKSGNGMSRAAKKRKKLLSSDSKNRASIQTPRCPDKPFQDEAIITGALFSDSNDDGSNDAEYNFLDALKLKEVVDVTSEKRAKFIFIQTVRPINIDHFYATYWQKKFMHINRSTDNNPTNYWQKFFSSKQLRNVLTKNLLVVGRDVHLFSPDKATSLRTELRGSDIFTVCQNGSKVILLNPIKYVDVLWKLCSALEHEFSAVVGCLLHLSSESNGSSKITGYDEPVLAADSFFLQLEGQSAWTVSTSAGTSTSDKAAASSYVLLGAGDTLYVPKGHSLRQTEPRSAPPSSSKESKSLSLTLQIYTNEANSLEDVLQLLLPQALAMAASSSRLIRSALPVNFPYFMGVAASEKDKDSDAKEEKVAPKLPSSGKKQNHSGKKTNNYSTPGKRSRETEEDIDDQEEIVARQEAIHATAASQDDPRRTALLNRVRKSLNIISDVALSSIDACFDQFTAKSFILNRLPVALTPEEEAVTAAGAPGAIVFPYTKLRMVRPGVAAITVEDGKVLVYHCMDNSRERRGLPINTPSAREKEEAEEDEGFGDGGPGDDTAAAFAPLEFELDDGPAIEALLAAYPNSVEVSELYHPSEELEDKVAIAQSLYKEGFLMIDDVASLPRGAQENRQNSNDDDDPF